MTMHILVIRCWVNNYLVIIFFNFSNFFKSGEYKPKGPFTNCVMLRGGLSDEVRDLFKTALKNVTKEVSKSLRNCWTAHKH